MKDFFYYSMIRSKDENTTKTRKLDGTVPLEELPNLMRAMGYYPTNQEVDNMKDEVCFSNFAETGQHVKSVDLNTFIRLFVNHRPVYGIGKNNIEEAFKSLFPSDEFKERGVLPKGKLFERLIINVEELLRLLRQEGETMEEHEIEECLQLLTGDGNMKSALAHEITADDFAENVLGFEEVEEMEEDEGDYDNQDMTASISQGRGGI
jgi:Ca2+-binding EF-hand superfamily protein